MNSGFPSTYTEIVRNNLCPFYLLESCASVCGVCGESAHFARELYFLSSSNVTLNVCIFGPVLVTRVMGVGRWWMKTWQVIIIYASFNKQHSVVLVSLFAENHFQPSCFNCVLIWNYLCWFLSPGKWKWGILHLVVNDFILYFPGEHECAYKRSPLLVFPYLLHSCERFYLKKRNISILYRTLSIFSPSEQSWLKFPILWRIRTAQTVVSSLVQGCLCECRCNQGAKPG